MIAKAKDRRWVTVRDAPTADRPVTIRWCKRVWQCAEAVCGVKTWTEQCPGFVLPRHSLTERAVGWATGRVGQIEATPASLARELGVTWSTVWAAVCRHGERRVDAVAGVEVTQVGFDETVMSPAKRHRRRRFITAAVNVTDGRIIDVFEGRNAADLQAWLGSQPAPWVRGIKVISVDPHEGYRSAVTAFDLLAGVVIVVDPFHIVRLAGQAVTKCRQRVQQATLEHRGWKGDPLYGIRKLLLMGAEHIDEQGWDRLHRSLRDGDPDGVVRDAWVAKEYVRDIYITDDPDHAVVAFDRAITWCRDPDASAELRTLAKTLTRWRAEILAHHTTGASNGRVEAANLTIKQVKRSGRGFRNLSNYRLRILLAGGTPRQTHPVTRHRARPSLIA
ncbi:MAG: ISL3 family transposase [Ilumatobacteraceae bacterium]